MLIPAAPESLDPRYAFDATSLRMTRLVHAGLTRLNEVTLEPVPYLASAWEWESQTTLTVHLREGVRFHSGRSLVGSDVVATVLWMKRVAPGRRSSRATDEFEDVTAPDDSTVVFHFRHPRASALADLDFPILRRDEIDSPPDREGALDGLGPFSFVHVTPDEFELQHSPTTPHRRNLRIRVVHNETARAMRLFSGTADIVVNGLSPALLPSPDNGNGLRVVTADGANVTYLLLNHDSEAFRERALRTAAAKAIDRQQIIDSVLGGFALPADTLISPFHWAHTQPQSSPREAPATLPLPPGAPLTLLTSTDRMRVDACRLLARQLAKAGFEVEVISLEFGTLLARLSRGTFDMAVLQIPELAEPGVLRPFLHSDSVPPRGANRARIHDLELDLLLDRADTETAPPLRKEYVQAIERRVMSEAHLVPLWHDAQVAVVSTRAPEFMPSSDGRWLSLADLK